MIALSAGVMIVMFGFAAYAVICGTVTSFLCFDTWLAQHQPRTVTALPAMSRKAFFTIVIAYYSVMLLAAFWLAQR